MDNYTLMRLSDNYDEDAPEPDEEIVSSCPRQTNESAQDFKRRYKEFYTDIKTDLNEDW